MRRGESPEDEYSDDLADRDDGDSYTDMEAVNKNTLLQRTSVSKIPNISKCKDGSPIMIAPKHVARLISARPNGPENFGRPIEAANDGSQRAGKKKPKDCKMAPISKNQNEGHFKKATSFGRRALDAVIGSRPFTKSKHGARPIPYGRVSTWRMLSHNDSSYKYDGPCSERYPEAITIKKPLQ